MLKIFISLMLGLNFFSLASDSFFEFKDYKFQGSLSSEFLKKLKVTFKVDNFFETGTYDGNTSLAASNFFDKVITTEVHPVLFKNAKKKFFRKKSVKGYLGNSSELIAFLAPKLSGTTLFWLDAHYCGEGTGLSNNSGSESAITAIRDELAEIAKANLQDCIIIIDDMRGFGSEIQNYRFMGCWAYPTIQEVSRALKKINTKFEIYLIGDQLLAYDSTKYNPTFSDTVKACTKTRLYDGYNLTDDEVLEQENIIKHASSCESDFIQKLYQMTTQYTDSMFWHDYWFGLINIQNQSFEKALGCFEKVKIRINACKLEEKIQKDLPYFHKSLQIHKDYCFKNI